MSESNSVPDPTVLVFAACQAPGAVIARELAACGCRVIVIDSDSQKLSRIAAQNPDQIETLAITDCQTNAAHLLKDIWHKEPITLVVNLMPLAQPLAITDQMRRLSVLLRTTAAGLVAGRGAFVTLVTRPDDPLALVGQGMLAAVRAGSGALADAFRKSGVRVHAISLPKGRPRVVVPVLVQLCTPAGRKITSATLDLD